MILRKTGFLALMLILSTFGAFTQTNPATPEPPYKKNPTLPSFDLLLTDSTHLTNANLHKQNTVIMYFSPDCEHCIHQMEDMKKQMKKLAKIQVIMVTHQPMPALVEFEKKHNLKTYKNLKAAQDFRFTLPGFFAINQLPFFALYDSNGKLVKTFESNTAVDKLVNGFNKKTQ